VEPINDVLLTRNLMEHLELVVIQHHQRKAKETKVERVVQNVSLFFHKIPSNTFSTLFLVACSLPKVVGKCRLGIPRFHYNSATKSCEQFTYGGCQGNENNFETKAQCETACKA
jgi:hypothetical protein